MTYRRMRAATPAANYPVFERSIARKRVAESMNPRNWALSFVGAVLGMVAYRDAHDPAYAACVVKDRTENGHYIKVVRLTETGTEWGRAVWVRAFLYYRLYDSVATYKLHKEIARLELAVANAKLDVEREQAHKLSLLSQNTVTRALVHAHSNDYCSETAVALISAGHKMPDVTLSMRVTLDIDVTLIGNDNYYPLRALFGATSGEVDGATGVSAVEHSDKVSDAIREQISNGDYSLDYYSGGIKHTGTSVDWKAPVLRQTSQSEAYASVNHHGGE